LRLRLLGLGAGLALVFAVLTRGAGRPPATSDSGSSRRSPVPPSGVAAPTLEVDPLPPPPARDIFRYADPPAPVVRQATQPAPVSLAPVAPTPPPMPLRLVGLVRRPGGLRAAVSTATGVVIVGPGDGVSGYIVLGVDEDRGLRLRGPDGLEHVLEPGS
jgi:hypothetical protein